jgi:hypothetical protein
MNSTITWQDGTIQHPYGDEGYIFKFSLNNRSDSLKVPEKKGGEHEAVNGKRIGSKILFEQTSAGRSKVKYIFNFRDLTLNASSNGDSGSDGTFLILDKGTCTVQ